MSTVFSARICVLGGGLRCVSFQLLVKQLFSARMLVRPKYIGIFCEDAGFCKNRMEIVRRCRRVVIGVGTQLRDYGPHDPRWFLRRGLPALGQGSQEKAEAQNGELLAEYNASVFYVYKHQMGERGRMAQEYCFLQRCSFFNRKATYEHCFSARLFSAGILL